MKTLLDRLITIRDNPDRRRPSLGICYHLTSYQFQGVIGEACSIWEEFDELAKRWPEYSGDYTFPVPHPTRTAEAAYHDAQKRLAMWKGKYGAARLRLLNWCIEQLQPDSDAG